jgi:ankyrin repeat protein
MASEQYSLNLDLHRAALNGNDEAIRSTLREGANINALDSAGRTTIMSAVAGEQYASLILFKSIFPYNKLVGKIWARMTRLF